MAEYDKNAELEDVYTPKFEAVLPENGFCYQSRDRRDYGVDVWASVVLDPKRPGENKIQTSARACFQLKKAAVSKKGKWTASIQVDRLEVLEQTQGLSAVVGYDKKSASFRAVKVEELTQRLDSERPGWRKKRDAVLRVPLEHSIPGPWLKDFSRETVEHHKKIVAFKSLVCNPGGPQAKSAEQIVVHAYEPLQKGLADAYVERHKRAYLLIKRGELSEAAVVLEKLVADAESKNVRFDKLTAVYSNLGAVLDGLGRSDEAIAVLEKAVKQADAGVNPFLNLANAYLSQGKVELAQATFERAWALGPEDAGVMTLQGLLLKSTGKVREALEVFQRTLVTHGPRVETYVNIARCMASLGDTASADRLLRKATTVLGPNEPKSFLIPMVRAEILIAPELKSLQVRSSVDEKGMKSLTFTPKSLAEFKGKGAKRAHRLLKGLAPLEQIDRAEILSRRIVTAMVAGLHGAAISDGRQLSSIPGHEFAGLKAMAFGFMVREEWRAALVPLHQAEERDESDLEVSTLLGQCYFMLEVPELAIRYCEKAASSPSAGDAQLSNLVMVLRRWAKPDVAIGSLDAVLAAHPESQAASHARLDWLHKRKDWTALRRACEGHLGTWPGDSDVRRMLAMACFASGDFALAVSSWRAVPLGELTFVERSAYCASLTRIGEWDDAGRAHGAAAAIAESEAERNDARNLALCVAARRPVPVQVGLIVLP